jgi:predicted small secreted protein
MGNPNSLMKSFTKPTLVILALASLCVSLLTGCNTMRGLGQDTEKAGEKIQEKASR